MIAYRRKKVSYISEKIDKIRLLVNLTEFFRSIFTRTPIFAAKTFLLKLPAIVFDDLDLLEANAIKRLTESAIENFQIKDSATFTNLYVACFNLRISCKVNLFCGLAKTTRAIFSSGKLVSIINCNFSGVYCIRF